MSKSMPNTAADSSVHVAVGVIRRDGRILLSRRAANTHQGGLWEFPGGKLEPGETLLDGLSRELHEELGITVQPTDCAPLIKIEHDYGDKQVCLDVCWVNDFGGQPRGCEGQPVQWVPIAQLNDYPLPAANAAIVDAIRASVSV
ncbi:MAG: 8-oxo-dGTP diphosphatase MutT [Spongiibacter sp.]